MAGRNIFIKAAELSRHKKTGPEEKTGLYKLLNLHSK